MEEEDIPELLLRNIPYAVTDSQLITFLESHSGHQSVRYCEIQKQQVTGRSRGFGFIKCNSYSATKLLLSLGANNRLSLQGRLLKVLTGNPVRRNPRYSDGELHGKLYLGNLSDSSTLAYLWSSDFSDVKLDCFYSSQKLHFTIDSFKMAVPFKSIASVENRRVDGLECLMFQLYWPPLLFKQKDSIFEELMCFKDDEWKRTTDFTEGKAIGQSTVYCIKISDTSSQDLNTLRKKLYDYNLGSYPPEYKTLRLVTGRSFGSRQELVPILQMSVTYQGLPLDVEFKVNYLIQDGYISPATITPRFFNLLADNSPETSLAALVRFEKLKTTCLNPAEKLETYLHHPQGNVTSRGVPRSILPESGFIYVKRLMVTPSKVYCIGPEMDMSNRVTRKFSSKIERFMRVTFTEEDFDKLNSNTLTTSGGLMRSCYLKPYERIQAVLRDGVVIGGLKFEFLAFSSSQLRESSVWMFASDRETSAADIRAWMGDFMSIRNVAKCAARMGQSFSTSTPTLDVHSWEVDYIQDVERVSDGKTYCFSDGIGKISKEFAVQVANRCSSARTVPSAFQIRYGGYKGVVAVDPKTSVYKLSLRPSMHKFPSTQTGLDVLSWTRYIPYYLNRQVITLLSTLGVPDQVFERLQKQVVDRLDIMFRDREAALDVLKVFYTGECHRLLVALLRAGYQPGGEPYLSSLLQAFREYQLMMLQIKSRILVSEGRCLMGCMDEVGALGYGECFVQVSPPPQTEGVQIGEEYERGRGVRGRDRGMVVQGPVVVAKNPCLHPGDVFKLEAVDVPELHHMVDCVVFPRGGQRPHPNECSGSDLDGDLYFISWNQGLIPPTREPPMDYEPAKPIELDHSVTVEEIVKFFADFLTMDSLGVICNSHTALADSEELQAKDPKCLQLAMLSSIAVDFPKTGVPATITLQLRPKKYPDFMEKRDKQSYVSERVIGKMYRSVKEHRLVVARQEHLFEQEFDRELLVQGYESHVSLAEYHKGCYDEKLMGLLNQYDITEAEAMSGSIRSLSKYYKKRQGDVKDRISISTKALVKEARGWFEEEEMSSEEKKAMASAWYYVTYSPAKRRMRRSRDEVELLSFPWSIYDKLLDIKTSR